MKILITRHGQTNHNILENGDKQINETGFKQIQKLINHIKNENISYIISSPSERCKTTTHLINSELNVTVEYDPLIKEKNNGDFEGKHHSEIDWSKFEESFELIKPPNGENLVMVRKRTRLFWKNINEKFKDNDDTILIVSHGVFLKVFIGDLLNMPLYDSIFRLHIDNCSLTTIDIDGKFKEGYIIESINNHSFI